MATRREPGLGDAGGVPGFWRQGRVRGVRRSLFVALGVLLSSLLGVGTAMANPLGQVTEFAIPTGNSGPEGIAAGPDGNLWITEGEWSKVARITPSGQVTEFAIPTPRMDPMSVCELEAGSPRYHVPRFQMIAERSKAKTMAKPEAEPTLSTNSTGSNATMP